MLACAPAFGSIIFVSAPFANNDSVNWSQLGADGTAISQSFGATSVASLAISGSFAGSGGGTTLVTPGSWPATAGSFNSGDSLIWTGDNLGNNNGPLTISFPAVKEAGLWIQADLPGAFTAQVQVFEGAASSTFTLASAGGAPIFMGGTDSGGTTSITKLVFSLTSCNNGNCSPTDLKDFAVDTLFLTDGGGSGVPEPGSFTLLGMGLVGIGFGARKKLFGSRRTL